MKVELTDQELTVVQAALVRMSKSGDVNKETMKYLLNLADKFEQPEQEETREAPADES